MKKRGIVVGTFHEVEYALVTRAGDLTASLVVRVPGPTVSVHLQERPKTACGIDATPMRRAGSTVMRVPSSGWPGFLARVHWLCARCSDVAFARARKVQRAEARA